MIRSLARDRPVHQYPWPKGPVISTRSSSTSYLAHPPDGLVFSISLLMKRVFCQRLRKAQLVSSSLPEVDQSQPRCIPHLPEKFFRPRGKDR